MPNHITSDMWWVVYVNDKPTMLASGAGKEQTLENISASMLGQLPPDARIEVKHAFDVPADDVLRVGIFSLMSLLMGIMATAAAVQQQQRSTLRH